MLASANEGYLVYTRHPIRSTRSNSVIRKSVSFDAVMCSFSKNSSKLPFYPPRYFCWIVKVF